jgi:hypothetical protein
VCDPIDLRSERHFDARYLEDGIELIFGENTRLLFTFDQFTELSLNLKSWVDGGELPSGSF